MGQKDLTQKELESYPDVFAELINVLLYEGQMILKAGDLRSAPTETSYLSDSQRLRNQLQDISVRRFSKVRRKSRLT